MVQLHGDEGPSFCAEVRAPHGRARSSRPHAVAARADVQALERLPHRLPPARRLHATACAGGTGETVRLAMLDRPRRSTVPLILVGRPDAGQRRRGDRRGAARSPSTSPAAPRRAGRQGPREGCARVRARRCAGAADAAARRGGRGRMSAVRMTDVEHRFGPYGGQYVPETLMPALGELEEAWLDAVGDPAFRAELDELLRDYVGPPVAAVPRAAAVARSPAARSTSSARTSTTPARTRSTTRSARRCWPSAWASRASSPRPARASTASRRATACALLGPRVRRLHGRRGHRAPEAQRRAHAAARRDASCRSRRARGR